MRNSDNVAIFWDYENCSTPSSVSGYDVVNAIRSVARPFGSVNLFKAYCELTETRALSRSELQSSGVSLTDCPHNGRKDVADKMILVDMLAFAIDNPTPCTIILISGDRDFAYALSILRLRRYRVVLITLPNAHVSLTSQPSLCLDWSEVVAIEAKSSIGANFTHTTPSRCVNDSLSPPPTRNNVYQDDDLGDIDITQYVRSRIQRRNNGPPQSPSKASTNTRVLAQNNTPGSSYAASSDSGETCVNNGHCPCSTPPNLAQPMNLPLEPTNRKPLETTLSGNWNTLSNKDVANPNLAQPINFPLEPTNRKPLEATFSGDWNALSNKDVANPNLAQPMNLPLEPTNRKPPEATLPGHRNTLSNKDVANNNPNLAQPMNFPLEPTNRKSPEATLSGDWNALSNKDVASNNHPILAQPFNFPLEPTNRKPLKATLSGDWDTLSNKDVAKSHHDAKLSQKQASPRKVKPLSIEQTISSPKSNNSIISESAAPNLGNFDFTILPDWTNNHPPNRLQDLSTGLNGKMDMSVPLAFVTASANVHMEPPPPAKHKVSSPTTALLPSALINEIKLQTTKLKVPEIFAFLIQRLQQLRSKGQFKVIRSNLAFELTSTPLIFARAGVTDSNQYLALAQDFGIVQTGQDNNKPWVALCEDWFDADCDMGG